MLLAILIRARRENIVNLFVPQLTAAGWILRTQTAFFQAAFAAICLLGLDG